MLVQEVMHGPPLTVTAATPLSDAYQLMQSHSFRHLPVVDEGEALVGVVTDRDLRFATSALHPKPFSEAIAVSEVMTRHPITASPIDPVEEASRLMHRHKIGCLPVLEGTALVGIVTVTDLLEAMMRLMGMTKPSGRIAVLLDDRPGRLASLTKLLSDHGANIQSVLTYAQGAEATRVILRVDTLKTRPLAESLRKHGFEVAWPPPKP
jgi:acetoin utilization protein AcuB